jgi:hypothetical protein
LKYAFLFICSFISFFAHAQILNIERYRLEKDTTKNLLIKATAGLSLYNRSAAVDAPVNLFGYKWDINSMYHTGKHALIFVSNFDYLKINDNDFLNFGLIHGRAIYNMEKKLNYESYVQYSFDNFRGLAPRWIFGGSFRDRLINSEKITFVLGIGLLYENETWLHPIDKNDVNVDFVKSSNYASLRWTINDYVDLNMVQYYQVGYDKNIKALRNRFNGTVNLNTKISNHFSFTNSFEYSFEDKPIVPITRFIFAFRSGISFDF